MSASNHIPEDADLGKIRLRDFHFLRQKFQLLCRRNRLQITTQFSASSSRDQIVKLLGGPLFSTLMVKNFGRIVVDERSDGDPR